jgi:hypothetical protein
MSTQPEQLAAMIERRNKALIEMDMSYFREIIPMATCDEVRLIAAHKARYECAQIPPEFLHSSGAWLRDHGMKRLYGEELLPEGQLPE